MTGTEKILNLVEEALNAVDDPGASVSALARKAARIARLRNDFENLLWIEMELSPLLDERSKQEFATESAHHLLRTEHERIWKTAWETYLQERKIRQITSSGELTDTGAIDGSSLAEIEHTLSRLRAEADLLASPFESGALMSSAERARVKMRGSLHAVIHDRNAVLERVRQRVYDFLSRTEKELYLGHVNARIFQRIQSFVDERLRLLSPDILEQFKVVYRRIEEGDDEALSQALTSCRRILKGVADAVYPAGTSPVVGSDGKTRMLTDDKFIARLHQYCFEAVGGSAADHLLLLQINEIGSRLDRLNDLSSKGVHASVSLEEAERCIVQTYLVIGDVLRLEEASRL